MINIENWGFAQYAMIVLWIMSIGINLADNGRYSKRTFSGTVLGICLQGGLLIAGGFFKEMGAIQWLTIVLLIASFINGYKHHGEWEQSRFSTGIISLCLVFVLYYFGGFFA